MAALLNIVPRRSRMFSLLPSFDLFDRFFNDGDLPAAFREPAVISPVFDLAENEEEYTITGELPGLDVKDVEVQVSDGVVTISGEKREEKEDKGEQYHRVERHYGSFYRSFRLPDDVSVDKSKASYNDGVLKLVLPKTEERPVKKIEIKTTKPRKKTKKTEKAH